MQRHAMTIDGLSCAACVGRAETAIRSVPGVSDVAVNLSNNKAYFVGTADAQHGVVRALDQAGYPVRDNRAVFSIEGLHCASCVARLEEALGDVPGVTSANVNLATQTANVTHLDSVDLSAISDAAAAAGYPATPKEQAAQVGTQNDVQLKRDVLWASALTLPVFVLEMGSHIFPAFHHFVASSIGLVTSHWVQAVLTTLVLAGPGRRFFKVVFPPCFAARPR